MTTGLEKRVHALVRRVPVGRVVTYGQVAELLGPEQLQVGTAPFFGLTVPSDNGVQRHEADRLAARVLELQDDGRHDDNQ